MRMVKILEIFGKLFLASLPHQAGVTAITEILGSLSGPFTVEFVELPKREFTTAVDLWHLGVGVRS